MTDDAARFIAAAVAVGLGALGTGWAQSRIGPASTGLLAERPEAFGNALILLALPETLVILGFVIGILLLFL